MRPGIYRGRDAAVWGVDTDGGPIPVATLEEGVRLQLTEDSYLHIGLEPATGEMELHVSGKGTEHLLFRSTGGYNTGNIRVELRSGSHYLGQAPEPQNVVALRERTADLDRIRLELQNHGPRGRERGLTPEQARELGDRLHHIINNPTEAK